MTTARREHRQTVSPASATRKPEAAGPAGALDAARRRKWRQPTPLDAGVVAVVVAVVIVGALTSRFFSLDNGRAILASTASVGMTAIGATVIMIAGSAVSLAVSQTATVVAMIFLSTQQLGLATAIVLALVAGSVVTALQGALVGFFAANPIVLTIAAGFAIGGVATWISGGTTVYPKASGYKSLNSTPLGLPLSVYVLIGLTVVAEWLLRRTATGRQIYFVGESRAAARAAGLPVGRVIVAAWAFFGACIALSGVFLASFNTSATAALGGTLTLDAVAAVLVGGTAIGGGTGSAVRTFAGAVLISVISDLLLLRGYSTGIQLLVKGLLVLLVVVAVHLRANRGRM
jgi:simple sugar transport system permease protein/ribose transport system permease protein